MGWLWAKQGRLWVPMIVAGSGAKVMVVGNAGAVRPPAGAPAPCFGFASAAVVGVSRCLPVIGSASMRACRRSPGRHPSDVPRSLGKTGGSRIGVRQAWHEMNGCVVRDWLWVPMIVAGSGAGVMVVGNAGAVRPPDGAPAPCFGFVSAAVVGVFRCLSGDRVGFGAGL